MLNGQVAIISGALGDIGRAIALELASAGADVALGDVRPPAEAETVLEMIRRARVRARYDRTDVRDAAAVAGWIGDVESTLGVPTLVVVNAAVVRVATLQELTPQHWEDELRVNLTGGFYMAQAAARRLIESQKPGRIVFIGSWAAASPHVQIVPYCVAKAGLRMLCKCMALELAPSGILVNEIAPGYVQSGLSGQIWEKNPGAREQAQAHVPTGQLITPEEVALEVVHLCDPRNRHTTGTVITMDGGLSLVGPQRGAR